MAEPITPDQEAETTPEKPPVESRTDSAALLIALGILSSRILGLVREKVVAYFFGVGEHLDVYQLV
ncbi:MAG: hypothetical protein IIC18_11735, partial [Bacteroidetes bacterium]|nr:hypothetical protein [Bacteroidota bacterium]